MQGALIADTASSFSDDSYYKSLDTFYSLRDSAVSGAVTQAIDGVSAMGTLSGMGGTDLSINAPSLWPVIGPIRSSFGQRQDPIHGNGEGEFHTGIDISAPIGTPIRAAADGTVKSAAMESGYGREVIIDHGHNVETCYAHMSGFTVMAGQTVVRGQVIGYVGMSGPDHRSPPALRGPHSQYTGKSAQVPARHALRHGQRERRAVNGRTKLSQVPALFARITHMPHCLGGVVRDEERSVSADGDAHRTAPDLAVGCGEASEEVLELASGAACVHGDADDFVAGAVTRFQEPCSAAKPSPR